MRSLLLSILLIISVLFVLTACTPPPAETPSDNTQSTDNAQNSDNAASDEPADIDDQTTSPSGTTETGEPTEGTAPPAGDTVITPGNIPQSELPEGWREDIPLLQGFEIQEFTALPNGGMFALTKGNVNPDVTYNFYSALPGWEPDPEAPVGQNEDDRSIGLMKGETKLIIAVIVENGATLLNISAHN